MLHCNAAPVWGAMGNVFSDVTNLARMTMRSVDV